MAAIDRMILNGILPVAVQGLDDATFTEDLTAIRRLQEQLDQAQHVMLTTRGRVAPPRGPHPGER